MVGKIVSVDPVKVRVRGGRVETVIVRAMDTALELENCGVGDRIEVTRVVNCPYLVFQGVTNG